MSLAHLFQCSEPLHRLLEGSVCGGNGNFLFYPLGLVDQLESDGLGMTAMSLPPSMLATWLWKLIMCTYYGGCTTMHMYGNRPTTCTFYLKQWLQIRIN